MTVPASAGFPEGEELPSRIGPYLIRRRIGQGGMGVVYQAEDPRHDRLVAIKVLKPEVAGDHIARARLAREVETMRRVHSANVAEVLDADIQTEIPWVVTEYVPGPTLDSTVTDHGPLRGRALTRFVSGMAQAISDIHAADVIHRDLKPGNVIISNGEPIVIDFGIAHAVDGAKLTQTGTFVGTPSYLSPEVIEGTDLGPATDVHAWGATVTFAATGNAPYGSGSFEVIFFRILNGEISMEGMPEALKSLVMSSVSRDMASRPTAAQLVAATGRLNLDLPPADDLSDYRSTGTTGRHTVQGNTAERPSGHSAGSAMAAGAGAVAGAGAGALAGAAMSGDPDAADPDPPRTQANPAGEDPGRTMAAGSGGVDQTMRVGDDPQSTGLMGSGDSAPSYEDDSAGPHTMYYNSTLRPEDFRDILTPVDDQPGRRRPSNTGYYDKGDDNADSEAQRSGLLGRFKRSGGDRLSDYWGSANRDNEAYTYDEPRRLPSLILVPLLVFVSGLCLLLPMLGLIVGMLSVSVLGGLDTVKAEHARRLQTRGPRNSDTMVVALSMPWAFLRTLGRALLYGLGYLLVGIVVGLIIGFTFGYSDANSVGSYALFVVVLLSFLGPNGGGARRQSAELTERIGIRNIYVYWGSIVAVVLLAMLVVSFGFEGGGAVWSPMAGPNDWFG